MKKLLVVVVLVAAIVFYLQAKMAENDRLTEAADDFFQAACRRDSGAADRLVMLRPCLGEGYRLSVVPGGDRIDMDAVVSCLNGKHPIPTLNELRTAQAPFPTVN